jgi:hypothetical protein
MCTAGSGSTVGRQEVAALGLGQDLGEAPPGLGEDQAHAGEEPVDFGAAAQEDAAQDQARDPLGVGLGIGQRQGRAPGAAEHEPARDAQLRAQPLHVGDQVPGRVVGQLAQRRRAPGAALVEDDDAVVGRIEEAAVVGRGARARPAVQENDGLAGRVAGDLPVDAVVPVRLQPAGLVGLDRRKQVLGCHRVLPRVGRIPIAQAGRPANALGPALPTPEPSC